MTQTNVGKHQPELSVVVVVSERYDDPEAVFLEYERAVKTLNRKFEFVYVLDGPFPDVRDILTRLQKTRTNLTFVQLAREFGEAACLSAGFSAANGEFLITLPAYYQIVAEDISNLLSDNQFSDVLVARRYPRIDSHLKRLQAVIFNKIVGFLTNTDFHDLGCGVRLLTREAAQDLTLYGDQYRFIPIQALQHGFTVREVSMRQSTRDLANRFYGPGIYLRRLLDILTVFFLSKFTRKPLRFFGLIGFGIASTGGVTLLFLISERILFSSPLADRPLLFISALLIVLGAQLFAIGLLGELIIFMQAKSAREYKIKQVVN